MEEIFNQALKLIKGNPFDKEAFLQVIKTEGFDINYQLKNKSILFFAVRLKNNEATQILLDNDANPNVVDRDGNTPLHLAAQFNKEDIAVALLKAGANNKIKNDDYKIAAQLAPNNSVLQKHLNQDFGVAMSIALAAKFAKTPDARKVAGQLGREIVKTSPLHKIVPGNSPTVTQILLGRTQNYQGL